MDEVSSIDSDSEKIYEKDCEKPDLAKPAKKINRDQLTELLKFCKKPTSSLFWKTSAYRLILYTRKTNEKLKNQN